MAKQQIADGKPVDDVMQEFAHKLSNYLMHAPTKAINIAIERKDANLKQTLADAFELGLVSDELDPSAKPQ